VTVGSVRLDLAVVIEDCDGKPLRDGDTSLTLGAAVKAALGRCGTVLEQGQLKPASAEVLDKRYKLLKRVRRGEAIEVSEFGEIRQCLALMFFGNGPDFTGPINDELDRQVVLVAATPEKQPAPE